MADAPGMDPRTNSALAAVAASGLSYEVRSHGPARSLAEAAELRGVEPGRIIKSMVVRHGPSPVLDGEFAIVLVPGDRVIAWKRLRALLGVNRAAMLSAQEARDLTGFERGTITPFGSRTPLPVIADERIPLDQISMGGGAHGVAIYLDGADLLEHFDAKIADITDPDPSLG